MTPVEWSSFARGHHVRQAFAETQMITHAWLTARLSRTAEFPSLQALLTPPVKAVELPVEEVQRQQSMIKLMSDKLAARKARKAAEAAGSEAATIRAEMKS